MKRACFARSRSSGCLRKKTGKRRACLKAVVDMALVGDVVIPKYPHSAHIDDINANQGQAKNWMNRHEVLAIQ